MILYLIKNNFKLIFRNKLAVVVLLLGPLLTIALLSNAFNSLMQSYEAPDQFAVGYRNESSLLSAELDAVRDAAGEAGIVLYEYPEGDPAALISNNDLSAFVEFRDKDYRLYKSGDHKTESMITEYFIGKVMNGGIDAAIGQIAPAAEMASALPVTELEFMPAVSSTDYYGIIYIIYFSSLGLVCATGLLGSEKKNGIEKKYQVCSVSPLGLYLARMLPTAGVVIVCTLAETIATVLLFDIHWGAPLLSGLLVCMMIVAGCAFGFMLYSISQNIAVTIIAEFAVIWILGYLGGSFETYMYSDLADTLKQISPFYHVNRALVELSCMGHSAYVTGTLLITTAIIIVCSLLTVTTDMLRRRGRA